jgi:CBS domain-containing protein
VEALVKRWLYAADTCTVDVEEVEHRLGQLRPVLQLATGSPVGEPSGDGSFLIDLPARALGRDLAKQVRVHPGVITRSGSRVILSLRWHAEPSGALFPSFEGSLEVEPLATHLSQLALVGASTPPLGVLGGVLDAALLQGIASQTALRVVRSLCRVLETEPPGEHERGGDAREGTILTVGDLMTSGPLVVDEDVPLRTCAQLMHEHGVSGLPVLDGRGVLCGVLSEGDLLPRIATDRFGLGRRAEREERLRGARTAGAACSRPARVTVPDAPLASAVREMLDHDVSRLVVLDGGQVAGIVTRHDVIRALTRSDTAITRAVEAFLRDRGASNVEVDTLSGHVRLRGEVQRRSRAEELVRIVAVVHGVDSVDADALTWRVDDLVPLTPPHLV